MLFPGMFNFCTLFSKNNQLQRVGNSNINGPQIIYIISDKPICIV